MAGESTPGTETGPTDPVVGTVTTVVGWRLWPRSPRSRPTAPPGPPRRLPASGQSSPSMDHSPMVPEPIVNRSSHVRLFTGASSFPWRYLRTRQGAPQVTLDLRGAVSGSVFCRALRYGSSLDRRARCRASRNSRRGWSTMVSSRPPKTMSSRPTRASHHSPGPVPVKAREPEAPSSRRRGRGAPWWPCSTASPGRRSSAGPGRAG